MYHRKKNMRKGEAALEGGMVSPRRPEHTAAEEVGLQLGGQLAQTLEEAQPSNGSNGHLYDRGSAWVLDHIIPMCKRMGLGIEGRETELLAFLASLEANKTIRSQADDQFGVGGGGWGRGYCLMTANVRIISWNVRGLNCSLKRGSVRWVLQQIFL